MPQLAPLIPIAAGVGGGMAASAAVGALALEGIAAVVVGVAVGAVAGAAIGAVGAAITGGDIGKGALYGAIGGAVAGGFAGWGAAAEAESSAAMTAEQTVTADGTPVISASNHKILSPEYAAEKLAGTSEKGLLSSLKSFGTNNKDLLYSSGVQAIGQGLQGWAQSGEAEKARKAASEMRQKEFEQRMAEIRANHEASMAAIEAQGATQEELLDKKIEGQLRLQQDAERAREEEVAAANQREDDKRQAFNNSIVDSNEKVFDRPTLTFKDDLALDSEEEPRRTNGLLSETEEERKRRLVNGLA